MVAKPALCAAADVTINDEEVPVPLVFCDLRATDGPPRTPSTTEADDLNANANANAAADVEVDADAAALDDDSSDRAVSAALAAKEGTDVLG